MALKEVDAISDAIIETEREIAGDAWGQEDTELTGGGDRSLEEMGEGLEGQQEQEEDEEADGDEGDGDGENEAEVAAAAVAAEAAKPGEPKDGEPKPGARPDGEAGRVPSGKLREANERARAAEAERDTLRAEIAKGGDVKALSDKLELALRQIDDLRRPPAAKLAEPVAPKAAPDIFEDPKGFVEFIQQGFRSELQQRDTQLANQRVETSMAIAHAFHKDTFEKAFSAINGLNPQNPDDRVTVQRIYAAPNPGEALVAWHKRNETLKLVGDDPTTYAENIRKETREALMKDPEFKKTLIAELRAEATRGDNGTPRSITRLPTSLHRASGSNLGAERGDPHQYDDSDSAVADAAWR
jgi:hypothetical protein